MKSRIKGVETISERFFNGSQSVEFTGVYKIREDKVKVDIDRDSYDKQCSAVVKVYNSEQKEWNFLEKIPYNLMAVVKADVNCYRKVTELGTGLFGAEKTAFDLDIADLLMRAKEILL